MLQVYVAEPRRARGARPPPACHGSACQALPTSTRRTTSSGTGATGHHWEGCWRASSPAPPSPESDSPPGGRRAARDPRGAAGGASGASARVAPTVARGQVWLRAHPGRTAVAGAGQPTGWARWSVCVGMGWVARSAAEGKGRRWARASRASGRCTPAPRDRVGRQRGLVPWQCPRA